MKTGGSETLNSDTHLDALDGGLFASATEFRMETDFPDKLIVLPCWPQDVPVSFTLHSSSAGRVEVRYRPAESLDVKLERPFPVSSPLRDRAPLRVSSLQPANG